MTCRRLYLCFHLLLFRFSGRLPKQLPILLWFVRHFLTTPTSVTTPTSITTPTSVTSVTTPTILTTSFLLKPFRFLWAILYLRMEEREKGREKRRWRRYTAFSDTPFFTSKAVVSTFSRSSLPFSSGALRFCGLQEENTQAVYTCAHMVVVGGTIWKLLCLYFPTI